MKQCKVCGTLVHIDSNTCPSCGNHNFFVLDVKICPLCGKVNGIANSFCEQCGKPFVTAQGGAYIKRPTPVKRPAPANYPKIFNQPQQPMPQQAQPAQMPQVAQAVYQGAEELSAQQAFKDFVALQPQVTQGDDYSEVSYYVKGEGDKLPVIILPKFAKTSGKNIIVNIVVEPKDKPRAQQEPTQPLPAAAPAPAPAPVAPAPAPVVEPAVETAPAPAAVAQAAPEVAPAAEQPQAQPAPQPVQEEFKPFSAITPQEQITPQAKPYEDSVEPAKPAKKAKPKKAKRAKKPTSAGKVFVSILLTLLALGALGAFVMPFYNNAVASVTGISPAVLGLEGLSFIDINLGDMFNAHRGYADYIANPGSGTQFAVAAPYIEYAFYAAPVLLLITAIISLFSYRHKKCTKGWLILFSVLTILLLAAIGLAVNFVFATDWQTLQTGYIASAACAVLYFLILLIFMRTKKKTEASIL